MQYCLIRLYVTVPSGTPYLSDARQVEANRARSVA